MFYSKGEKKYVDRITDALYVHFFIDPYIAYWQFVARRLKLNESVDDYWVDQRRLADPDMTCTFVVGLPEGFCFTFPLEWIHLTKISCYKEPEQC